MADFGGILATLRKEEKQLAKRAAQVRSAIKALTGGGGAPIPLGKGKGRKKVAKRKRTSRKMTAAQKKAVSARMKKYWAGKRKKSAKKKSPKS